MEETKEQRDMKKLIEEKENFVLQKKRILESEDDEDMEILKTYRKLDRMREACGANDAEILQLLDEKESILKSLRKKKMEFEEKLQHETKKDMQRIEELEADIQKKNAKANEEENN